MAGCGEIITGITNAFKAMDATVGAFTGNPKPFEPSEFPTNSKGVQNSFSESLSPPQQLQYTPNKTYTPLGSLAGSGSIVKGIPEMTTSNPLGIQLEELMFKKKKSPFYLGF